MAAAAHADRLLNGHLACCCWRASRKQTAEVVWLYCNAVGVRDRGVFVWVCRVLSAAQGVFV